MSNELTDRILHYMEDKSARYAIALEGDWGSGKTRYCENELVNKLYPLGYDVLRVSLFGVSCAEEVYSRLAMALLKLSSGENESRAGRFFKGLVAFGGQALASYGAQKFSDMGITVETSPQLLTGMLGRMQLLVFDDVERCGFKDLSSFSFYGLINNLIEAQGCKVMFVTNSYDDIPSEIREKVIWKCFSFEPNPEDLVRDIILPRIDHTSLLPEFDVSKTLSTAASIVSCRNARAMMRVTELLLEAVSSEVLSDKRIDAANRAAALRDYAQYAFRAAMDDAPTDQFPEGDERGEWIERIHRRAEYNAYQQLWVIKAFFDPKNRVNEGDVDECLKSYIESNYAGSPETMDLKRTLDGAAALSAMEDDEAAALAAHLSYCLMNSVFDLALLNRAIQVNTTLEGWGFEEALSDEVLLRRAKELVDGNEEEAYRKTHREFLAWREEWANNYVLLVELDTYIVEQFEKLKARRIRDAVDSSDPDAGQFLADEIRKSLSRADATYLEFNPNLIAEVFVRGNAASQYAIHELIAGFGQLYIFNADERAREWVQRLYEAMSKVDPHSKMGKQRLKWILGNLKELIG